MCSIKAAILDSLHGKNPPNNESADCKNLACFKSKSDRGAWKICKRVHLWLTGRLEHKISKIGRLEPARSLKTWSLHIINVCSIKAGKMLSQVSKMGTSLFRPKASWISNALTPNATLKCQRSKMAFYLEFASKTDIFYQKVLFGLYVWLLLPLRCVLYRDLCQKKETPCYHKQCNGYFDPYIKKTK